MELIFIVVGSCIALLIVIGLIVSRLYHKASKEVAFVRTGLGGQKVILNGGALVLPVLHETIPVNMNTLRLDVQRANEQALITRDRMRVDVMVEFYVRVKPTEESIADAAQTLGMRTMEPDELKALVEGKFVDVLRAVAADMTMEELHEKRVDFVQRVHRSVSEDLLKNGLELETVSLTGLDQTRLEYLNEKNAFDAQGMTFLTRQIEDRRKERNDIEQETKIAIQRKNLEADQASLKLKREEEYAKMEQEREIATRKAAQSMEISRERAEKSREAKESEILAQQQVQQAEINARRLVEEDRIQTERSIETAEIAKKQSLEAAEIDKAKAVELVNQDRNIAISIKSREEQEAKILAQQQVQQAEINARCLTEEDRIQTERNIEAAEIDKAKIVELANQDRIIAIVMKSREAKEAEILAQRKIQQAEISARCLVEEERIQTERSIETAEIEKQRTLEAAEIDKAKTVELANQDRNIAIAMKSREQSEAKTDAEHARALAVKASEQVLTVQEVEQAERQKEVELVRASQNAERDAIALKIAAESEKQAAEDKAEAIKTESEASADKVRVAAHAQADAQKMQAEAAQRTYAVDAEGKRALHEAANLLSQEQIAMQVRMELIRMLPEMIRESVKPMENIDSIRIVQADGLTGHTSGGSSNEGAGNLADQAVNSALRYRAQAPLLESLMNELGLSGANMNDMLKSLNQQSSGVEKKKR